MFTNAAEQRLDQGSLDVARGRQPTKNKLAVVVPVYDGKAVLRALCEELVATLETITHDFSIVLVDDRSADDPWPLIKQLGDEDPRICGVQLSRNFGQHYALTAGMDHAYADWYVVMDCDFQDSPSDIPLLWAKAQEGYDVVLAVRDKAGHSFFKRNASRLFYSAFNRLAGFELDWSVGNFRILSNRVADGFRRMREQMRFFPASLNYMGFNVGSVKLPHHPRAGGKSSYTMTKLAKLATNTILAHSQTPLRLVMYLGIVVAILAILAGGAITIRAMVWDVPVPGWASLMVVVSVLSGVQIFITGVVGIYVGKTFEEAKKRPLYFVRDTSNLEYSQRDNHGPHQELLGEPGEDVRGVSHSVLG
ncbi:MAG: glycosyltransferase family 2 protein [Hyphomonadaceae bacterium]